MTKHLTVLLFAMAVVMWTSNVHAQSVHVYAHTTLDSTQQAPHRAFIECGTELDNASSQNYRQAQTNCHIYKNGQDFQSFWVNAGNPASDGWMWTVTQPGTQYQGAAVNWVQMNPDTVPSTCLQWGWQAGGYMDIYHYQTVQGSPIPQFTDEGWLSAGRNGPSICWNSDWGIVADTWGFTRTTMQVSPRTANVSVSQTQTLTSNMNANWAVSGLGFISPNSGTSTVTYNPPSSIPSQQTVTVTAYDPTNSANNDTATITLVPLKVTISPCCAFTMLPGTSKQFKATVGPAGVKPDVTWKVTSTGSTPGTVDATGLYKAPVNDAVIGTQFDTIQACSAVDTGAPCS